MCRRPSAILALVLLSFTACTEQEKAVETVDYEEKSAATQSAIDLWKDSITWLETWEVAPGTQPMQKNTVNPHGTYGTVLLNETAMDAALRNATEMPAGAVIARKNFDDNQELIRITAMHKTMDGWFWASYDPNGIVETAGTLQDCIDCHKDASVDMVFFLSSDGE